jgi:hypothetical protein
MARIRNVKPEFYSHEELNDLEARFPELKPMLVFSGLWNQCEYSGVFAWSIRKLKLAILPFIDFDLERSLDLLENYGFVRRYRNGGKEYGHVINFTKYQAISGSERARGLKYPLPDDENSVVSGTKNDDTMTEPGTKNDDTMTEPGTKSAADLGHRTYDLGQRTKEFTGEENFDPSQEEPPENQSFSTADAVVLNPPDSPSNPPPDSQTTDPPDSAAQRPDPPPESLPVPQQKPPAFSPVDSPPERRKKLDLTPEQNELYHAAKACFEASEKAKALMYQDAQSAEMQMRKLKEIICRCSNIAPGITVDFLKSVLEHFKAMTSSPRYKGNMVFTPRCLSTHWVWEIVISSLPERETELDKNIRESVKGLFKGRV